MKLHLLVIQLLIIGYLISVINSEEVTRVCTLIQSHSVTVKTLFFQLVQPEPILVQCIRNNEEACCNSMADAIIQEAYTTLLSESCISKFPELEAYFCYGCDKREYLYNNPDNKTIIICSNLVKQIWGQQDLSVPTKKYDQCGMRAFWDEEQEFILPSAQWSSALEFLNEVKPPLFEDYTIIITDTDCYQIAIQQLQLSLTSIISLALILYLGI